MLRIVLFLQWIWRLFPYFMFCYSTNISSSLLETCCFHSASREGFCISNASIRSSDREAWHGLCITSKCDLAHISELPVSNRRCCGAIIFLPLSVLHLVAFQNLLAGTSLVGLIPKTIVGLYLSSFLPPNAHSGWTPLFIYYTPFRVWCEQRTSMLPHTT